MTSQGLVVLNQQTQPTYAQQVSKNKIWSILAVNLKADDEFNFYQKSKQVFLSQPPPVGPTQPVFQSGQHLAFQSPATGQQLHAAVSVPVSYQFQVCFRSQKM